MFLKMGIYIYIYICYASISSFNYNTTSALIGLKPFVSFSNLVVST